MNQSFLLPLTLFSVFAFIPEYTATHPIGENESHQNCLIHPFLYDQGGIIRGDTSLPRLSLVMTGHEFADGYEHVQKVLQEQNVPAGFFFTGDFYRNPDCEPLIQQLRDDGHYLGAHSDKHLLYCPWEQRDSLLVSRDSFRNDLLANYAEMARFGILKAEAPYFMPPYEWYNDSISAWTEAEGLRIVNFTPGTRTNADYTTPDLPNYLSSEAIWNSLWAYEAKDPHGLNGFLLLVHLGTDPKRTDKFYHRLEALILKARDKGYRWVSLPELLPLM